MEHVLLGGSALAILSGPFSIKIRPKLSQNQTFLAEISKAERAIYVVLLQNIRYNQEFTCIIYVNFHGTRAARNGGSVNKDKSQTVVYSLDGVQGPGK